LVKVILGGFDLRIIKRDSFIMMYVARRDFLDSRLLRVFHPVLDRIAFNSTLLQINALLEPVPEVVSLVLLNGHLLNA
jgi:hypothetical protein